MPDTCSSSLIKSSKLTGLELPIFTIRKGATSDKLSFLIISLLFSVTSGFLNYKRYKALTKSST
jgi:hypothetical protein